MRKLGALWLREGKNKETGEPMKFFSGELEDMRGAIPVVIFKNNKKEKENHPDYIIYLSEDRKPMKEEAIMMDEAPEGQTI